jgi:hypothetical protein
MRSLIFFHTLAMTLTGCVSDQANRYYATEKYPPKETEEVEVLHDEPAVPYVVIADFQARGASEKYMRKKAAEIGADAVIVGTYGGYRAKDDQWASEDSKADWYTTYKRVTGTAIKYTR